MYIHVKEMCHAQNGQRIFSHNINLLEILCINLCILVTKVIVHINNSAMCHHMIQNNYYVDTTNSTILGL